MCGRDRVCVGEAESRHRDRGFGGVGTSENTETGQETGWTRRGTDDSEFYMWDTTRRTHWAADTEIWAKPRVYNVEVAE